MDIILGIESSCDETSAALCINGKVINNIIATQSIHQQYGGVVPELASRMHHQEIIPVVNKALVQANIKLSDLSAIACTQGPGLLGALLVGYTFAKSLAYSLQIPLINIHHMKAHVLAHLIDDPKPNFPFLCLTVSGGHTQIILVKDIDDMIILGETIDDAVGEAFDKGAKLLGLTYPGGPEIDRLAQLGNPKKFEFSQSNLQGLNFSFSGIKTSLLYFLKNAIQDDPDFIKKNLTDICASYQYALIDMLLKKIMLAAKETGVSQIAISGGVAANNELRKSLQELGEKMDWQIFVPNFQYCTDNAGMIAITGYFKFKKGLFSALSDSPQPRMPF